MYIVERYVNRGWNSANDPNSPEAVSGQGGRKLRVRRPAGNMVTDRHNDTSIADSSFCLMVHCTDVINFAQTHPGKSAKASGSRNSLSRPVP
jgi:hypothetical protein